MSDFNNDDFNNDGFDDVARRAGRGLGAITPTRPAAATVRKRVARRRATMLSSVAAGLVVVVAAVSANNDADGAGPNISIATSPSIASSTSIIEVSTTTRPTPLSRETSTTADGPATTTLGATTTTTEKVWITVDTPTPGMAVAASGPLRVTGTAKTFESTVNIKIYDANHNLIVETFTMTAAPDIDLGPYTISIDFPTAATTATGTLEVFEYSAKDGEEIHKVIVPIIFAAT